MATMEDVRSLYRGILNREPESEDVLHAHLATGRGLDEMAQAFVSSDEFKMKFGRLRSSIDIMYDGLHGDDEALLQRHLAPIDGEDGFVNNFLGVRMRVSHNDHMQSLSGHSYRDVPTRVGDYHAEPIEFVGTLKAIEAGAGRFVVAELGAGWGSWSIIAGHVARRMGRHPVKLYAVEASAGKVANMQVHYRDNGFDPERHVTVNAIVGAQDGFALFPLADVTGHWGEAALFTNVEEDRPGYERVRSISIKTLLKDEPVIDLIHFDIQGAEADAIQAALDFLTERVRYMVVGTHSRAIEGRIIDMLLPRGWQLENDQPACIRHALNGNEALYVDGTQVWRNPAVSVAEPAAPTKEEPTREQSIFSSLRDRVAALKQSH